MMYDHEKNKQVYRKYMENIAYRFKFKLVYEDNRILKIENGVVTVLATSEETPRKSLSYRAWLKLKDEYDYRGFDL